MLKPKDPWLLIDSNGICWECKYGLKGLSFEGMETGIIFGFLNQVKKMAKLFSTRKFIFTWDSKKSIRRSLYPEYKRHRRDKMNDRTPQEIMEDNIAFSQFFQLRRFILPKFGFKNQLIRTGFESDDILASLVIDTPKTMGDSRLIVASRDEDLYQLLNRCDIYNFHTGRLITKQTFEEQHGINPLDWAMVKQIGGCTSDNVKGVPGVGEDTAIRYIRKELSKGKRLDTITTLGDDIIKRNAMLVCLPLKGTEPEGGFNIQEDVFGYNDFIDICEKYNFQSFLKKDSLGNWIKLFAMK